MQRMLIDWLLSAVTINGQQQDMAGELGYEATVELNGMTVRIESFPIVSHPLCYPPLSNNKSSKVKEGSLRFSWHRLWEPSLPSTPTCYMWASTPRWHTQTTWATLCAATSTCS